MLVTRSHECPFLFCPSSYFTLRYGRKPTKRTELEMQNSCLGQSLTATPVSQEKKSTSPERRAPLAMVALLGRILFGGIFIASVPTLFQAGTIALAKSAGVPFSFLLVPIA